MTTKTTTTKKTKTTAAKTSAASKAKAASSSTAHQAATSAHHTTETFKVKAHEVVEKVKSLIAEGNVRSITVEDKNGKTLFTIPVTFGVISVFLAPWLAAIGVLAAVVTECTIRVEKNK